MQHWPDVNFWNVCRDEKCLREDVHDAHGKVRSRRGSFKIKVSQHSHAERTYAANLVAEMVYDAISDRVLKPFSAVYDEVIRSYGTLNPRRAHRALRNLVEANRVAVVIPSKWAERMRDRRNHRGVCGGYIRYDSPLLWQPDGLPTLISQADEMQFGFEMRDIGPEAN